VSHGTIVILGSGETAPGMVKVHRAILDSLETVRGVTLDTPYGFQENVPQLTEKITSFFATSLTTTLNPASLTSFEKTTELQHEIFRDLLRNANYAFAGPGSPSYALKQWLPLGLGELLEDVLARDGVVCFSSAAALTLGERTAPIYEMYKVGDPPSWLPGLDLLRVAGLRCAIIPHFDNAEGGNHDTRFCYLGEPRLLRLEALLDPEIAVLGVDEHTAVIINLTADSLEVRGRGAAYWRSGGTQRTLEQGAPIPLSALRNSPPRPARTVEVDSAWLETPESLGEIVLTGGPDATVALARLVQMAATGGAGFIEAAPLVDGILAARAVARAAKLFDLSDQLRDLLTNNAIEVSDTADGVTWSLRSE